MVMSSLKPESKDNINASRTLNECTTRSYSKIPDHQTSTSRASVAEARSIHTSARKHNSRNNLNRSSFNSFSERAIRSCINIPDLRTSTSRALPEVLRSFQSLDLRNNNRNNINSTDYNNNSGSFSDNTMRSYTNIHNHQTSTSRAPVAAPGSSQTLTLKFVSRDSNYHKSVASENKSPVNVWSTKLNGSSSNAEEINITGKQRGFKGWPIIKSSGSSRAGRRKGLVAPKYASHNAPNCNFLLNSNILDGRPLCQGNVNYMSRSNTTTAGFRECSSVSISDDEFSRRSISQGRECAVSRTGYTTKWIWTNSEKMAGIETKKMANVITSRDLADVHTIGVPKTGCIRLVGMPPDLGETLPFNGRKKPLTHRSQQCDPGEFFTPAVSRHSHPGILIRNKTVLRLIKNGEKGLVAELVEPEKAQTDGVSEFNTTIRGLLHSQIPKALSLDNEEQTLAEVHGGIHYAYQFNRHKSGAFLQQAVASGFY